MKKTLFFLNALIIVTSSSLFAASSGKTPVGQMQGQQSQMMPDCSQLTADEQNFANQLVNTNNRTVFCSQFTPIQRQQAMQMMGQQDAMGNMMNADQSVQQVMQNSGMSPLPMTQPRSRAGSSCPVK